MPMRVGFIQFRKQMMEQQLAEMMDVFPTLGIEKAILIGVHYTKSSIVVLKCHHRSPSRSPVEFSHKLLAGQRLCTVHKPHTVTAQGQEAFDWLQVILTGSAIPKTLYDTLSIHACYQTIIIDI